MVARHAAARKREPGEISAGAAGKTARIGSGQFGNSRRRLLGAPGRSRAAHVMQFRPVRVERRGGELAPEGAKLLKQSWLPAAAACRLGVGSGRDARHDEARLFFPPQLLLERALWGADGVLGRSR